jgi:hypothetical protein
MDFDVAERGNRDLNGERFAIENRFEARPSGCTTLLLVVNFEYTNARTFDIPENSSFIQRLPS